MCVANEQYKLLEFVFNSVYVDLQYNYISPSFSVGSVCLCVVTWLSLFCMGGCLGTLCDACAVICVGYEYLRECDGDGNAGMVAVSAECECMGCTCSLGIVSSADDVLAMSVVRGVRGVGGVCEMCICMAWVRVGKGGVVLCLLCVVGLDYLCICILCWRIPAHLRCTQC